MIHLTQPVIRTVQVTCFALGKAHSSQDRIPVSSLVLAHVDQGIVIRQDFFILFLCRIGICTAGVRLYLCGFYIQNLCIVRKLGQTVDSLRVAGRCRLVSAKKCIQTRTSIIDLDLQCFQHLFCDIGDFFHIDLIQCGGCRLIVTQSILVGSCQLVHLSTSNVSFCLCIWLLFRFFDGCGVVRLCIVVLLQAHISLGSAHICRNVLRVKTDGFGKGGHSLGVVQLGQILLSQLHLFHGLGCLGCAGREKQSYQKHSAEELQKISLHF